MYVCICACTVAQQCKYVLCDQHVCLRVCIYKMVMYYIIYMFVLVLFQYEEIQLVQFNISIYWAYSYNSERVKYKFYISLVKYVCNVM